MGEATRDGTRGAGKRSRAPPTEVFKGVVNLIHSSHTSVWQHGTGIVRRFPPNQLQMGISNLVPRDELSPLDHFADRHCPRYRNQRDVLGPRNPVDAGGADLDDNARWFGCVSPLTKLMERQFPRKSASERGSIFD